MIDIPAPLAIAGSVIAALFTTLVSVLVWIAKEQLAQSKNADSKQEARMHTLGEKMDSGFHKMTGKVAAIEQTQAVHGEQINHLSGRVDKLEQQ